MTKQFTLGADPEMFVRDAKTKLLVPVCGKVGGTKANPTLFYIPGRSGDHGWKYQEDNVAFEVNIPQATSTRDFDARISAVLGLGAKLLTSKGLVADTMKSAHRFSTADLSSDQAQVIGCDPDMCAYGGDDDNPRTREPFDIKDLGNWRFAGGHIHFGYDPDLGIPAHVVVRLIDACVYLPFIDRDKQKSRRPMYGLAGLYRPKPYGVEYRTMSNFWLTRPSTVSQASFNLLYDLHNNIENLNEFYQALPIDEVKKCIDSGGVGRSEVQTKIMKLPKFGSLNISANFRDILPVYRKYGGLGIE